MPGNPKECREHAKRCLQLADETTNPALRDSLLDISTQWIRLAADLDRTWLLLAEFGEPQIRGSASANNEEPPRRVGARSCGETRMSAMGQKQTFGLAGRMSAKCQKQTLSLRTFRTVHGA
jgi:hypothetical protein